MSEDIRCIVRDLVDKSFVLYAHCCPKQWKLPTWIKIFGWKKVSFNYRSSGLQIIRNITFSA